MSDLGLFLQADRAQILAPSFHSAVWLNAPNSPFDRHKELCRDRGFLGPISHSFGLARVHSQSFVFDRGDRADLTLLRFRQQH